MTLKSLSCCSRYEVLNSDIIMHASIVTTLEFRYLEHLNLNLMEMQEFYMQVSCNLP